MPEDWTPWFPRPEIAPRFFREGATLALAADGPASYGAWRRVVKVSGGQRYRFSAAFRTQGVADPRRSVSARLDWRDENGERARPPDFARESAQDGAWTRMEYVADAPPGARSVAVDLALGWSAGGTVWWNDATLGEEAPSAGRRVRAVTIAHRPRETNSSAESVAQFCRLVESAAPHRPDIVCLPEGITLIGTGKNCAEVGEPVPGPTTETLGALAARLNCYIAAGIYERVDGIVYNTAVLLGRRGEIVGTYRKTHLPYEEVEAGLTPGDAYPVFPTDFGTVGLLICWDLQFPEAARALALQGAEMILLPIWGGSEVLARARAIENHVFLVTSGYDIPSLILDPAGRTLAQATPTGGVACAELALDRPLLQPWLGDMGPRTWKEHRRDIRAHGGPFRDAA